MRSALCPLAALSVAALLLSPPAAPLHAQQSSILAAMQDEMSRSMSELRMKDAPPPYFIAYELQDRTMIDVSGRLGALVEDPPHHIRVLRVEVRVGSYDFDSSRFAMQGFGAGAAPLTGETVLAPLDDDYDALRREIWITTDEAYKRAVNVFARKKAAFQNRATTDPLPDFSKETPVETELPLLPSSAGRDAAARVQQPSAAFGANDVIDSSGVDISAIHGSRYYLNSEGFRTITPIQLASLAMYAETQAGDGMPVRETYAAVERTIQDLPSPAELVTRARELAARVTAARNAPVGEEFTGPVLLEGLGSSEFVAETLVPLVLARRSPDAENPRVVPAQPSPFLTRTGLRVMADAFSASDTPSLKQFQGKPVAGAYLVDEEGVRAKDVALINKGRLVTLLSSRIPQRNFPQSNGHGRAGGAQAGVFQLESALAIPAAELRNKYLALLKAQDKTFGYIVRGVRPAVGANAGPGIDQVVKVTLDGREEPVRGLRFANVPSTAFRDLSEASEERTLYNYRPGLSAAVSVIAPSLIFEELEIQRTRDILQKPPIVPSPLKSGK
jgi:microcin-processing metallopeptidase PmbA/TldD-like protein